MDKVYNSAEEAIADVIDGSTIAIGGFFVCGVPRAFLQAIIRKGVKNLTLACGSGSLLGAPEELRQLVENRQLKKIIDSYPLYRSAGKGKSCVFEQAVRQGEIELEVYPMGTLAEKYRTGGAGIAAFFTPTGVGSIVENTVITNIPENRKKKETRTIDGKKYVLEYALRTDFAFIHAHTGDREGNLRYKMTSRNFNHVMAAAGKVTIAGVENLVEPGEIDPESVHTPGIYVQRVVKVDRQECAITID